MDRIHIKKQGESHNKGTSTSVPRQLHPISTVESVVTKALKTSANKVGLSNVRALVSCLKRGDSVSCSLYRYNIAKQLAEVLGSWDKDIRAIYTHDYEGATPEEEACFENTSPFSLVHMLIWAERKTNALDALVETIDRAMVQHHRQMLDLTKLEHVLDVQVIDDEDVRSRTGYAALLMSIYQPPIQIWRSGVD